jgi:hypothetical protein
VAGQLVHLSAAVIRRRAELELVQALVGRRHHRLLSCHVDRCLLKASIPPARRTRRAILGDPLGHPLVDELEDHAEPVGRLRHRRAFDHSGAPVRRPARTACPSGLSILVPPPTRSPRVARSDSIPT